MRECAEPALPVRCIAPQWGEARKARFGGRLSNVKFRVRMSLPAEGRATSRAHARTPIPGAIREEKEKYEKTPPVRSVLRAFVAGILRHFHASIVG